MYQVHDNKILQILYSKLIQWLSFPALHFKNSVDKKITFGRAKNLYCIIFLKASKTKK